MDDKEKKIIENLDYMTADVKVPDSLKPEAVERMLKEHKVKDSEKGKKKKKLLHWKPSYSNAVAAAAVVLILFGLTSKIEFVMALPDNWSSNVVPGRDFVGQVKESMDLIPHPDSYEEIFQYIQEYQKKVKLYNDIPKENAYFETEDAREESSDSYVEKEGRFSETNVRTKGVSEGDIVKTDGEYLYILKDNMNQVVIVDVRGEEMKEAGIVAFGEGVQIFEFYIEDNKLIALGEDRGEDKLEYVKTVAVTYDLSNLENIKKIGTITQSGNYASSRIVDGYLYVFSNFGAAFDCKVMEYEKYIPEAGGRLIPEKDILLPFRKEGCSYYVVSSVNLDSPDEIKDSKGIFHNGGLTYVSSENIFLCEMNYNNENEATIYIRKISYKDGQLTGKAAGEVPGRLESSFSIDEYDGYLRLVVTCDKQDAVSSNSVYVLDKNLKMTGSIKNLAEDERIYSARFMGDTAYFVTYRETDPLFSVDLSNPKKPKIIGSLKIPGFSEYLHPYGDGLLLGIGMDMDEKGVTLNGVKLSMFDISNPSDVKEIDKVVLERVYGSQTMHDYKAVLIDVEKNMIGFSAYGDNENYYVFGYDKRNGFKKCMEEEVNNTSWMMTKGLYVGDKLYVVGGNVIEVYEIPTYEKVDDLILPHSPSDVGYIIAE